MPNLPAKPRDGKVPPSCRSRKSATDVPEGSGWPWPIGTMSLFQIFVKELTKISNQRERVLAWAR